jgi:hypothetical protein
MTPLQPEIILEIIEELAAARRKFPHFHSAHEGYAVILEELDELWDEVRANGPKERMRAEAIQIAAMAIRFVEGVCDG